MHGARRFRARYFNERLPQGSNLTVSFSYDLARCSTSGMRRAAGLDLGR
jgi:hypothetical protein